MIRTKETKCSSCDATITAATGVGGAVEPSEGGGITICLYCHGVFQFNADMTLRPADEDAQAYIKKNHPQLTKR